MPRPRSEVGKLPRCPSSSLIDCMDRRCRLRRGFPRMLRTFIWPLAFAAMDDAGAAAFRAWPHVESVSDVAATAIVTDHAWPQNLDSVDACEPITLESTSPQRTLRSAPPENRRGASDGTVTTLRPPLGDALTNAELTSAFGGKADIERTLKSGAVLPATAAAVGMRVQARQRRLANRGHDRSVAEIGLGWRECRGRGD
jgi:hypothetical protein